MTAADPSRLEAVEAEVAPDSLAQQANDGAARALPVPRGTWWLVAAIAVVVAGFLVALGLVLPAGR